MILFLPYLHFYFLLSFDCLYSIFSFIFFLIPRAYPYTITSCFIRCRRSALTEFVIVSTSVPGFTNPWIMKSLSRPYFIWDAHPLAWWSPVILILCFYFSTSFLFIFCTLLLLLCFTFSSYTPIELLVINSQFLVLLSNSYWCNIFGTHWYCMRLVHIWRFFVSSSHNFYPWFFICQLLFH